MNNDDDDDGSERPDLDLDDSPPESGLSSLSALSSSPISKRSYAVH